MPSPRNDRPARFRMTAPKLAVASTPAGPLMCGSTWRGSTSQRPACAQQQPRQDVAAKLVGSQRMRRRRVLKQRVHVLLECAPAPQLWSGQRDDRQKNQNAERLEAGPAQAVPPTAPLSFALL